MARNNGMAVHSALPDLENIDWLISRIESHWEIVQGEEVEPDALTLCVFPSELAGGFRRTREIREQYRREWQENRFDSPAKPIADALTHLFIDDQGLGVELQEAIENALLFAVQACRQQPDKAELYRFGWELTRLVALDIKPVKEALDKARRAGGTASADAAREQFDADAAATCTAARRIIDGRKAEGRDLSHADLVHLLGKQGHGTPPTIRARLRTQGLYPPARKNKAR